MQATQFHRPASVTEAVKLLTGDGDAKLIAGGQSLLPSMRLGLITPTAYIDLGGVADLQGIRSDGKSITIGAATTHASVAASADVRKSIAALAALASGIGDRQVRNRGTIGGS